MTYKNISERTQLMALYNATITYSEFFTGQNVVANPGLRRAVLILLSVPLFLVGPTFLSAVIGRPTKMSGSLKWRQYPGDTLNITKRTHFCDIPMTPENLEKKGRQ